MVVTARGLQVQSSLDHARQAVAAAEGLVGQQALLKGQEERLAQVEADLSRHNEQLRGLEQNGAQQGLEKYVREELNKASAASAQVSQALLGCARVSDWVQ